MKKKLISIIFFLLFIVAAIQPLKGKPNLETIDTENFHISDWITLPDPMQVDMVLERSISRRMSFHGGFPSTPVTDEDLSTVLWAAYGLTSTGGRTVYSPNGTYSTTFYVIRSDATYLYSAANHSLHLWKTGNYLYLGQNTGAPIKFGLVWNQSIASDEKAAMAEIGMIAQNVYFNANALDLATLTTGMSVNDLYQLDLPANEKPEIIMHLGHPPSPYDFTYNPLPPSNLPSVVNNSLTLTDAINTRKIVNEWNNTELTLLEQSQVLWSSYGTSYLYDNINNKRHRTVPSAINIYPFKIYAANHTGVYQYLPSSHQVSLIVSGDKRELIQSAVNPGNISVVSSPLIIIPFWDKNVGSQSYINFWQYESGAIVHNILLESAALNMSGNILSVITDQNALRSALGLSAQTNLVAMHVAMVGHANESGQNNPPEISSLSGPSQGASGVLYEYTLNATDVDGDDVYYLVDWGDQNSSGWIGPFASDTPLTLNHSWALKGTYDITARAKDSHGLEGAWSTPLLMTIMGPGVDITITGGVGLTALVNNTGTIDATNVSWEIRYEGGFIIPRHSTGTIQEIRIGEQVKIRPLVFGLGKKIVTVSVEADEGITAEATANVFFLVLFVIIMK